MNRLFCRLCAQGLTIADGRIRISSACIWLMIIGLMFSVSGLWAQEHTNSKDQLFEAESYFLYEEFNEALPLYMKLKERYPDNVYLDYKIGRCYLNIPFEKQKSLDYLQKAAGKITQTGKDGSFKLNQVPLDVIFYLGDAYRINNQLEKAINAYQDFKKQSDIKTYNIGLIDDQIQACRRAQIMEKNPVDITKQNLGDVINTRFSETHPVVSEDESILMYATQLPFYQAVFFTKKINNLWQPPVNIIPDLGIDGDCLPTCLSADGTEAYFYRSDQFKGDIYVSNFVNGKWTKIRKLNNNINTRYWESHASLSHDGKTLYFTSNRPGGMGGLDIYQSQRTSGDNWGPPKNLGPVVNSTYNEDSPFITADGKRLYFTSFGHETMGGYDVFYSDLDANGNWTKPVNLGYPVNSTDDEVFFCPVQNGKVAYVAEYDPAGMGKYDLMRIEIFDSHHPRLYKIAGSIHLPDPTLSKKVSVVVTDRVKRDTVYAAVVPSTEFLFNVKAGNYDVSISSTGFQTQVVPIIISMGSKELIRNLTFDLITKSTPDESFALINNTSNETKPSSTTNPTESLNHNSPFTNINDRNKTNTFDGSKATNTFDRSKVTKTSDGSIAVTTSNLQNPSKTTGTSSESNPTNPTNSSKTSKNSEPTMITHGQTSKGLWGLLRHASWIDYAIPGSLIILILFWLIRKKRRKSDQN